MPLRAAPRRAADIELLSYWGYPISADVPVSRNITIWLSATGVVVPASPAIFTGNTGNFQTGTDCNIRVQPVQGEEMLYYCNSSGAPVRYVTIERNVNYTTLAVSELRVWRGGAHGQPPGQAF